MEYDSNWNVTQNGMILKFKCHFIWNVADFQIQIEISPKLECNSNWNVTQIGMSRKLECHSNMNIT